MTTTVILLLLLGARLVVSLTLTTVCHRSDHPHFTDVETETEFKYSCITALIWTYLGLELRIV